MHDSSDRELTVTTEVRQGSDADHLCGRIKILETRDVPDEPDQWFKEDLDAVHELDPYKRLVIIFRPESDKPNRDWMVNISFDVCEYYVNSVTEDIRTRERATIIDTDTPTTVDAIGEPVAEFISNYITNKMATHTNKRERIEEQLDNTDEIVAAFKEHDTDELLDVFESDSDK